MSATFDFHITTLVGKVIDRATSEHVARRRANEMVDGWPHKPVLQVRKATGELVCTFWKEGWPK